MAREWHAVNLNEDARMVTGIRMCDGEAERSPNGDTLIVLFEFCEEDFRLLKRLQSSQYPRSNPLQVMFTADFVNMVYKISRLFTDILGDYERTAIMKGTTRGYRIKPALKDQAREIMELVAV